MSSTVDNRVVKMVLDNAQFEKAIDATIQTIARFEKSLSFSGAAQGFEGLTKAAGKVDFSSLSESMNQQASKIESLSAEAAGNVGKVDDAAQNADFSPLAKSAINAMNDVNQAIAGVDVSSIYTETEHAGQGFTAMSAVALGALMEIGTGIENYVISKLKGVVGQITGPIKEGFGEYESQIGAIQTIIANTGMDFDSDEDIAKVNARLDELNTYADKTVYKFGDMISAIGRFTASGLGLDESTKAVQGVANIAALSGASMSDVSRVLPQLAQALSSGTVSMQDWFSVETANMNSKIFVDTIADVAMHMAEVGKAEQSAYEAGDRILNQGLTMRSALNKVDSKDIAGWFSSDILANTLQMFTYDKRSMTASEIGEAENFFREMGYAEDEFDKIFEQATMAQRAAQEVRTFSQLLDTLGESIGSNWTGIWRNFIGDFKQATSTFSFLSQEISGGIDALFAGINNAALQFNKSGAWDIIFGNDVFKEDEVTGKFQKTGERIKGALDYILDAIEKPLGAIKEAFDNVFGVSDEELGQFLVGAATSIKDFASSLVISDDAAKGLKNVFEGLFSVVDLGLTAIGDTGTILGKVIETIRVFLDPILDVIIAIAGQAGKLLSWAHDKILEVREAIITVLTPFDQVREAILAIVKGFFEWLDLPGKIDTLGDALIAVLEILWDIVDIPGKIKGIGDFLGNIVSTIADITGWSGAVAEAKTTFEQTGKEVSALDIWIKHLLENPIVKFFADIAGAIISPIAKLGEFAIGFLKADEAGRQSMISSIMEDVKSKAEFLTTPLSNLFGALQNFFGAIGTFGGKVLEAITTFQPFVDLGTSVTTFFTELPEKLSNIAGTISLAVGGITNPIDAVINWFNEKAEYFNNVTVDQFIKDIQNSINGFLGDIKNFVSFVTTLSPETLLHGWLSFVSGFNEGTKDLESNGVATVDPMMMRVYDRIKMVTESIDAEFGLNGALTGALEGFVGIVSGVINGISSILVPALAKSESIPDIFVNIFKEIGNRITGFIQDTKEAIAEFDPQDLFQGWLNFKDTIQNFVNGAFPSLSGVVHNTLEGFTNFFRSVTNGATDWHQVLERILGKVKEGFSKVPEVIFNALDIIRKGVTSALAAITKQLSVLPGGIGEFFGGLSESLSNMSALEGVPEKAMETLGGITDSLSNIKAPSMDGIKKFDLLETVKKWVDEQINKLPEVIKDVPEKIGEFVNGLKEVFNRETIEEIVNVIESLVMAKLLFSVSQVVSGIGGVFKSVSKVIERFGKSDPPFEQLGNLFLKASASMGIIAAALYTVSMIEDVDKATETIERLALFVVAIQFLSAKMSEIGDGGGASMLAAAASIGVLAVDMLAAMYAIEKLAQFDWAGNTAGIIAGIAMLGVFGTFIALVTKFGGSGGGSAVSVAASILAVCAAMYLLLPAFEMLNDYVSTKLDGLTDGELSKAIGTLVGSFALLAGMLASVALAMRLAGDHALSAGIGIAAASLGVGNLADALVKVAELDLGSTLVALAALAGLLAEYAAMAYKLGAMDLIGTAAGVVIYAQGVNMIGGAIADLTTLDTNKVGEVSICLASLVAVFGLITAWTSGVDLIETGIGMVAFGGSIIEMSIGLETLSKLDPDRMSSGAIAITALVAALGLVTSWTSGVDMLATSTGMMMFGGAVIEMSMGLEALAKLDPEQLSSGAIAITALVAALGLITSWTSGLDLVASSAGMLLYADALSHIATALIELSAVPSDDITTASVALGALSGVLLVITNLTNGVDLVATAAGLDLFAIALMGIATSILIFAEALNAMPSGEKIHDIGYNLFTGIGEGMADGVKAIIDGFADIGGMIIDGIKNFFGIHSPSTVMEEEIGQYLPAGIAEGITGNTGDITTALSGVGDSILNWAQTDGLNMVGESANSMLDWVQTEGPGKFQEFLSWLQERGGELVTKFGSWMETDGIPMLTKAAGDIWNWVTTDGVELAKKFFSWLGEQAKELAGKFANWMENDGIPMLTTAAGDIWDWVTTDGVELVGKVFTWLGEQAAELGSKVATWFTEDAIPFLTEKLGDLAGALWDWLKELPGNIVDWLGEHSDEFAEVGDNIVQGIANGVTSGITWITNAITGLGESALNGIKDFFGIQSPSTVMRDEVGINLMKGLAVGVRNGLVYIDEVWSYMDKYIEAERKQFLSTVDGKQIAQNKLSAIKSDLENDHTVNDLAETIGNYFPKKIADAMINSPDMKTKNISEPQIKGLKQTITDVARAGYAYIDETVLEAEGKLDEAANRIGQYFTADLAYGLQEWDAYLAEDYTVRSKATGEIIELGIKDTTAAIQTGTQTINGQITSSAQSTSSTAQTAIQTATNSAIPGIQSAMKSAADNLESYSINLAQGLTTGITERGYVASYKLAVDIRDYIKDEFSQVMSDDSAKKFANEKLNSIEKALRGDNNLSDLVKTIGEYFPKEIADTLLKSPGLYIKNPSSGYIEWMKGIIYEVAQSGYGIVDSTILESEGKLDTALYKLLQYMNGSTADWLDNYNQYLTGDFEVRARAMANGLYEAGSSIPQAFIDGIGDIVNDVRPNSLYNNIVADTNKVIKGMGGSTANYASHADAEGLMSALNSVDEIMKAAAERLPTEFAQEFQKHTDLSVPQLKDSLEKLLESAIPNLTGEQSAYLTSIISAADIVNNTLDSQYYRVDYNMREKITSLEELSNELGRVLPENIYNGVMEHSNLPLEAIENIGISMKKAVDGAVAGDSQYYLEQLTAAYSSLVDSFYYEIDNANDVQELGEIIGRYFPEGMGTGIVENRDIPMQEMVDNLKWMAANGQLEVPGFNQTGEQLGLAVSDGVVKGLFADFGATGPDYITDYANQVKEQTGPFIDSGSQVGYAMSEAMNQQLTGTEGLVAVVDGAVAEIPQGVSPAAVGVGTTTGESIVTGTETGLSDMSSTVSGSVKASDEEAVAEGTTVGKDIAKAIIEAMNTQINDKETGLVATLKTVGDEITTQAEKMGNAIAEGVKKGIVEGFKSDEKGSINDALSGEGSGKKNFITSLTSAFQGSAIGSLSKEDIEALKTNEYKTKLVKVNETTLYEMLQSMLNTAVSTVDNTITGSGTATAKQIGEDYKTNAAIVLSEAKYGETLLRIDGNIANIKQAQSDNHDALLAKIETIKSAQDDLYDLIKNNTNDYLKDIESNTGRDMNIYMDSGSLVGAIADDMDNALGYKQILSSRGN